MTNKILIVDAMNTLIRSFSLLKAMNPSGTHIGGLVGFLRSLGYVTRIFDPTRVLIVWDGKGGSGNRQNIDPNYRVLLEVIKNYIDPSDLICCIRACVWFSWIKKYHSIFHTINFIISNQGISITSI